MPLTELTVTKPLTAAYYVYYVTLWLIGFVGGYIESPIATALGIPTGGQLGAISLTRISVVLMNLPLVHGLVNFHNVMRSMCFREDDTTGTGRGAEYRKDTVNLPKTLTPAEQREMQRKLRSARAQAKKRPSTADKKRADKKRADKKKRPASTGTTGRGVNAG